MIPSFEEAAQREYPVPHLSKPDGGTGKTNIAAPRRRATSASFKNGGSFCWLLFLSWCGGMSALNMPRERHFGWPLMPVETTCFEIVKKRNDRGTTNLILSADRIPGTQVTEFREEILEATR